MNNVPMTIGNNLKFDMMRIDDEFFQIDLIVAESFLSFMPRTVKG